MQNSCKKAYDGIKEFSEKVQNEISNINSVKEVLLTQDHYAWGEFAFEEGFNDGSGSTSTVTKIDMKTGKVCTYSKGEENNDDPEEESSKDSSQMEDATLTVIEIPEGENCIKEEAFIDREDLKG